MVKRAGRITVLIAVASALSMVAGCADRNHAVSVATSTAPAAASQVSVPSDIASLVSQVSSAARDSFLVAEATFSIISKCLAGNGITTYPHAWDADLKFMVAKSLNTDEGYAWWQSSQGFPNADETSPSPSFAQQYGYASQSTDPNFPSSDAAFAKLSSQQQDVAYGAFMGSDGNFTPTGNYADSCRGQASQTVYGGQKIDWGLTSAQLDTVKSIVVASTPQGQQAIMASAGMTTHTAAWDKCMSKNGLNMNGAAAPATALQPLSLQVQYPQAGQPAPTPAPPAADDIAAAKKIATIDASCAQSTGLQPAYATAVQQWRVQQIAANKDLVTAYYAVRAPQVANVKNYLGIK